MWTSNSKLASLQTSEIGLQGKTRDSCFAKVRKYDFELNISI